MKRSRLMPFSFALMLGLLSGVSGVSVAEDTEIYLGDNATAGGTIRPNIMFILDTSSSMTLEDGTGITRLDRMKDALRTLIESLNNVNVGLMRFHKEGGPVLYPVAPIDADAAVVEGLMTVPTTDVSIRIPATNEDSSELTSTGNIDRTSDQHALGGTLVAGATSFERRVGQVGSNNKDDAEEFLNQVPAGTGTGGPGLIFNDGTVKRGRSNLMLTKRGNQNQVVGLIFRDVQVPRGATITTADIEFEIDKKRKTPTNLNIYGEARDSAVAPFQTSGNDRVTRRVATNAVIPWNSVDIKNVNQKLPSPEIKAIIQEIVCRGAGATAACPVAIPGDAAGTGWDPGNNMALMLYGDGRRLVDSYDGEPAAAALLRITYSGGSFTTDDNIVGLRFPDVSIPQGYTITHAHIEFRAKTTSTDGLDGTIDDSYSIAIEDSDDAVPLGVSVNDISNRTAAPTQVVWDDSTGLTDWTVGPDLDPESGLPIGNVYQTPDLSGLLQQVVDRPGWCGGNAMVVSITGSPNSSRTAHSYDGNPSAAPILRVNYEKVSIPPTATGCIEQEFISQIKTGADDAEERISTGQIDRDVSSDLELGREGSRDQIVGLRFRELPLPQGATILDADITFTVDESDFGSTSLDIEGQNSDDALLFSTANGDLSGRPRTSAKVPYAPIPWETVGDTHTTPNIGPIVQEIIDRPGWAPFNNMAFLFTGSGERTADSYNGNPASAAVLRVKVQSALATQGLITVRQRLLDTIDELEYKSGTPIVDTLYEAALYYRGDPVFFGKTRGDQGSRSEFTRVSHPVSYTGSTGVARDEGCTNSNLNAEACKTETIQGPAVYQTPIEFDCQTHHIVLLTDGSPSQNNSVSLVESLTGVTCSNSGPSKGKCGPELVQFLHDNDQRADVANSKIITHVIGFNFSSSYIQNLALTNSAPEGRYKTAGSSAELVTAFNAILAEILSAPTSFATPSLTVNAFNKLFVRNEVYFSLFEPVNDVRWNGNVKKYQLCDQDLITTRGDGTPCILGEVLDRSANPTIDTTSKIDANAVNQWTNNPGAPDGPEVAEQGAQQFVPVASSRSIYTYTSSADPALALPAGVDLTAAENAVTDGNAALTVTLLGNGAMLPAERTSLINWMRGVDVDDEDGDGDVEESRFRFGDPLHASSVAVTYGGTEATPVVKLFVATNDGTLRMLNSLTGEEEWAFFPQDLLTSQNSRRQNVGDNHEYGLDLTPVIWQNDTDGDGIIEQPDGDFVRIIVGMRRGGRNYYALDVTPPVVQNDPNTTGAIQPRLMWRIEGGTAAYPSLGETWSAPQLTKIRFFDGANTIAKTVIIFAGGNDEAGDESFGTGGDGNGIFIADPATGLRIWHASNADSDLNVATMTYSMPAPVAIFDSDGDNLTDRLYIGDLGGQVFRVDLADNLAQSSSGSSVIGRFASISLSEGAVAGPLATETRKFYHGADVVQVNDALFSNEPRYDMVTLVSGSRPKPRNISTENAVYAFRDFDVGGMPDANLDNLADAGYPTRDPALSNIGPLTRADLANLTDNPLQVDSTGNFNNPDVGTFINNAFNGFRTRSGWFIDLVEDPANPASFVGEKGLARPVTLAGKLFFTTYTPQDSAALVANCQIAEGDGRLYGIDILTGAALFSDFNTTDGGGADPTISDRSLSLGGGLPSEAVPVFQKKGVTIIVGGGGGGATVNPGIGLPRNRTYWYQQ